MTGKITIISPPDIFVNRNKSILLVNTTEEEQEAITDFFSKNSPTEELNIYFYQCTNDMTWLLTSYNMASHTYINMNNLTDGTFYLLGYFLSAKSCYYKVEDNSLRELFNHINGSRVDTIIDFMKVVFGEQRQEPQL